MKKLFFIIVALISVHTIYAQHRVNSFFDDMGIVRLETQELQEDSNAVVNVFHRTDDVVWSRVVYRVVDMRFKQNYQLYTPLSATDPTYSSLLKVMLEAVADGMEVYAKSEKNGEFRPIFNEDRKRSGEEVFPLLDLHADNQKAADQRADERILRLDSNSVVEFNTSAFSQYAKNQLKYVIQEVIFFDKHYSRMYSKILAIAPMHADRIAMSEGMPVMDALYGQILFWVPFDAFRPYMAQQYVTPRGSDSKRETFDEFFIQKRYSSYLVGVNNIYNKMIPQMATTYEEIHKEQERIEAELLSVEQDLWEY
jgi:gliding motility associated protien GldN